LGKKKNRFLEEGNQSLEKFAIKRPEVKLIKKKPEN